LQLKEGKLRTAGVYARFQLSSTDLASAHFSNDDLGFGKMPVD
jgi:hypothetical protein